MSDGAKFLNEDELRSALLKAQAAGDFSAIRSILTQPHANPKWLQMDRTDSLTGAASRGISDAAHSNDISKIQHLFHQWRSFDPPLPAPKAGDLDWALVGAIRNGNKKMINLLLDSGAYVTPSVVRALVDPKNSNYDKETFKAILQSLLDHGWDVNMAFAIMYADWHPPPGGWFGTISKIGLLISANSTATGMQNEVLFNFLLTHGADPNVKNRYHWTPLSVAAREGNLPHLELLLSHGAKPDHNALQMAVRRPQSDSSRFSIIALLLSHGADINAVETEMKGGPTSSALVGPPHKSTVLFKALSANDVEMVRFLIEQGADPNVKNKWGEKEGLSSLEAVALSRNKELRHAILGEANSKVKKPTQIKQPRYAFRKRK